jgi:hypothetical protein
MFLQDVAARHLRLQIAGIQEIPRVLLGLFQGGAAGCQAPRCECVVDSEARSAGWYPGDGAPALRR